MSFLAETRIKDSRFSRFDELITGLRTSYLNIKPTWGVSQIRDKVEVIGTGAAVGETNGELKLSTGTDTTGFARLQTRQRGQYQAGAEGECGIGVRVPVAPVGDQFAEWGYFDDNNGFGFGVDSTGVYVFYKSGGTQTKTYQDDWNEDKLDGTGPSGQTLSLAAGNIYEMEFTWYGYGDVQFSVNIDDVARNRQLRVTVHGISVINQVTIVDPNQPIRVIASNGGSATSNFDVYVGGRQFSIIDGGSQPNRRDSSVIRKGIAVDTLTYIPVLAVREKSTFNGRNNSVNCRLKSVSVASNQKVYWYVSIGDTLDGSWVAIPRKNPNETALEQNITATAGGTTQYHSLEEGVVLANNANQRQISEIAEIALGTDTPITLWVAKEGTNATVDVVLNFEEEW